MSFSEWRSTTLGEITRIKGGKRLPKGILLTTEKNDHPYIRIRNLGSSKNINLNSDFEFVDDETFSKISRYIVNQDDVILSIVGTIGLVGKIGKTLDNASLTENCIKFVNLTNINRDFLYYFLVSKYGQDEIKKMTVGAVQPKLPIKNIEKIEIKLPLLDEQFRISSILNSLEEKIELNNRINKTLEEMAQAIFKNWFVDFEPFKDDEFIESEMGLIPSSFKVGTIGDLVKESNGGDWGKDINIGNYSEEVVCFRGADIPDLVLGNISNSPKRYILRKNLQNKQLRGNQVIIEISGGSPTQSTGRVAYISDELLKNYSLPAICTNFCRTLVFESEYAGPFVYSLLKYLYDQKIFFNFENGTTGIKNLDLNNLFSKYRILIPGSNLLERYQKLFLGIDSIRNIYGAENNKLKKIRDSLLPKLMSGEIRVPLEEVSNAELR